MPHLAIACFSSDALIHSAPQLQRFQNKGNFTRVPPHLPAPAPIARGLLTGNDALFQQHDGNAALGQFKRRCNANDAAADDGNRGFFGEI